MKVVLLQDIPKLGKRHEIKEVADGFARNVLLPAGKVVIATAGAMAWAEKEKANKVKQDLAETQAFQALAQTLQSKPLIIILKANKDGHLFASLRAEDILKEAQARGLVLKKEWLILPQAIKTLGEHQLVLQKGDRRATITLRLEGLK